MNETQQATLAISMAADLYQIHPTRLLSKEASSEATNARRLAAWLLRAHDHTVWSLPRIARALNRTHPYILKATRQVEDERMRMPWFENQTDKTLRDYQAALKEG